MTTGLTFNSESLKIYTDSGLTTELASEYYVVQDEPDTGDTFTIQIKDTFSATNTEAQILFITYTATLNKEAINYENNAASIIDQTNTSNISFGNKSKSTDSTNTVTTHKFSVLKHAGDDESRILAGAEFKLWNNNGTEAIKLVKLDDTNYRVAASTEAANVVEIFTTTSTGAITIWGVDSDGDNKRDYQIEEIKAPEGYNKRSGKVDVTVGADNNTQVKVSNSTTTELPSTGGAGLYVIAGVAIVALLGFGGTAMLKRKVNGED